MSRTYHARRTADDSERPAPPPASKRKRALFSFKRIDGVTSMDDATTWEPAQAARR